MPRRLPNKGAKGVEDAYIQVSCGKCYACLANRRRSWLFRLENENLNCLFTLFLTLTYNDDCIPKDHKLCKPHLQKFFKRLAHYEDIKYYAIGEYGTDTFRPHYHAVVFFYSVNDMRNLLEYYTLCCNLWPYGFVAPCRITYRRINYVLHYHTRPKEPMKGLKTFVIQSKGLGLWFLDDKMIDYLVNTKSTTIKDYNGNTYVIPRYYRKKLVDMGFDIDPVRDYIYDDSTKERIEKVFQKKIYQIPQSDINVYMRDMVRKDKERLARYNKQDKFI